MKILVTGSNGFLGKSFVSAYKDKCELLTLSRKNADINIDLVKEDFEENIKVDVVIHSAGKAHVVPKNEADIKEFYDVNVEGTKKILNILKGVKTFVFISSVAVYGVENGNMINETCPLIGSSPYADSKILAEKLVINWSKKNNVSLLILRLPLLAGLKPPGNLGSMIDAIKKNRYVSINKGKARRSIVLVDDIIDWLPKHFDKSGIFNLTDNDNPSFCDLEKIISEQLGVKTPISIPLSLAKIIGKVGDVLNLSFINSSRITKMTNDLTFCSQKATKELSWSPKKVKTHFKIS